MRALVIKDLPPELHRKLQNSARRHLHSVAKEALSLLEQSLNTAPAKRLDLPPAYKGDFPLTQRFLNRAKRAGRA